MGRTTLSLFGPRRHAPATPRIDDRLIGLTPIERAMVEAALRGNGARTA